jgi:hypothetical protein
MPTRTVVPVGSPCWADLLTHDVPAAVVAKAGGAQ